MSSRAHAHSYPSKRPKTSDGPGIDSFTIPAPPKRPTHKLPAANFQSAFQTTVPNGPIITIDQEKRKSKAFGTMKPPILAFGSPGLSPSTTTKKPTKKVIRNAVQPTSVLTTSPTRPRPKPRSESSTTSHVAQFRRIAPPPAPMASPSKLPVQPTIESKVKPLRLANPPPMPVMNLPPSKPTAQLKNLQPPKLKGFGEETSPSKLRTISETHIARATDINSETGAASLFSIALLGREEETEEGLEKEMRRGIGLSPTKPGRHKPGGFARNGLAERASSLLTRSQTAYTLWHKEVSSALNLASTSATPRRVIADMELVILRILHETPITHHSPRKPRLKLRHNIPAAFSPGPVIAVCRVLRVAAPPIATSFSKFPSLSPEELEDNDIEPEVRAGQVYPMVFSSLRGKVQQGEKVGVWRPWHGVDLLVRGGAISVEADEEGEGEESFWGGPVIAAKVHINAPAPNTSTAGETERTKYAKTLVCPRSLLVGS